MSIIHKFLSSCRNRGVLATFQRVGRRLFPRKRGLLDNFARYRHYFADKRGIEIGGPSKLFVNQCPVYELVKSLDGCNFSTTTVWEGQLAEGANYEYLPGKFGTQMIAEASDLARIADNSYDFLLASHCLEHCANALLTLREWRRVVESGGGVLLLVLPDRNYTFDHRRPVTKFEHLLADEQAGVDESDLTHLEEILELHELSLDPPAGTPEQFRERSLKNLENRCLHHHVYDISLLKQIFRKLDVQVLDTDMLSVSQYILGQKQ